MSRAPLVEMKHFTKPQRTGRAGKTDAYRRLRCLLLRASRVYRKVARDQSESWRYAGKFPMWTNPDRGVQSKQRVQEVAMKGFMKRFATILCVAAIAVGGAGIVSAQARGGGHGGGGSPGGGWHGGGGGAWHGGGGMWHGGGTWHGGSGWHGGDWHGHGGGSHFVFGLGVGWPYWGWGWPYYYYPYSYYYPGYAYYYPYYSSPYGYPYGYGYDPGGYVEKDQGAPSPAPDQYSSPSPYSYYCPDPPGYYPQVATCPKGWLRVVPPSAPGPAAPAPQ
jgi:hypothetical protein